MIKTGRFYWTCADCGENLNPGERCYCQDEESLKPKNFRGVSYESYPDTKKDILNDYKLVSHSRQIEDET